MRRIAVYALVVACWALFSFVTLTRPVDLMDNPYSLTEWEVHLLQFTIILPYLIAWLAAFRGALRLREYQHSLQSGEHLLAFRWMGHGLTWLAVSLVVTTLIGNLRTALADSSYAVPLSIAVNLLYVFFPLVGFYWLYRGARGLVRESDLGPSMGIYIKTGAVTSAIVAVQVLLLFTGTDRLETLHLSDGLILSLLVAPFAVAIALGTMAALNLNRYVRNVAVIIYEKSLPLLSAGIMMIVATTVLLQLLLSVGQSRLAQLGLGWLLFIIYLFLFVQVAGYLLVARGTGRLAKLHATLLRYGRGG